MCQTGTSSFFVYIPVYFDRPIQNWLLLQKSLTVYPKFGLMTDLGLYLIVLQFRRFYRPISAVLLTNFAEIAGRFPYDDKHARCQLATERVSIKNIYGYYYAELFFNIFAKVITFTDVFSSTRLSKKMTLCCHSHRK